MDLSGHRLSDFPHSAHYDGPLAEVDVPAQPQPVGARDRHRPPRADVRRVLRGPPARGPVVPRLSTSAIDSTQSVRDHDKGADDDNELPARRTPRPWRRCTGCGRTPSGFPALFAQSVAVISPTMTAVLIIPLAFASAGQGTWLAYAFGTVMLLFVVFCLNQFAKRSAFAGSMYAYTAKGLGPSAGVFSGWTLIWAYYFIAVAGHVRVRRLLRPAALGARVPRLGPPDHLLRHQRRGLLGHRLQGHPGLVDPDPGLRGRLRRLHHGPGLRDPVQARLLAWTPSSSRSSGVNVRGMGLAVVACIFSLVGFESATTLGGEAKNPRRNMPRAVIASLLITGPFMVFMAYVEVAGTTQLRQLGWTSRPAQLPGAGSTG